MFLRPHRKGLVCICSQREQIKVLPPSNRRQATVHWTVAFQLFESLSQCINKRRSESIIHSVFYWYTGRDSNPQPSEPESDALSIEPPVHLLYSQAIIAGFDGFVKRGIWHLLEKRERFSAPFPVFLFFVCLCGGFLFRFVGIDISHQLFAGDGLLGQQELGNLIQKAAVVGQDLPGLGKGLFQ